MKESVIAALKEQPQGSELLVEGDLNMKLLEPEGHWRGEEIAAVITTEVLEEMLSLFFSHWRSWFRDRRTWSMVWKGREVSSWTDYILGTDHHIF